MRRTMLGLNVAALLLAAGALAAEKKMKVQDLPPAVQQTVNEQTRGATLVGLSKEVEKGKTVYELETKKSNGQTRDLMIDEAGTVLSVEEEVALDSVPAAAKAAIEKAAAGGKVTRVETLTEGKDVSRSGHPEEAEEIIHHRQAGWHAGEVTRIRLGAVRNW